MPEKQTLLIRPLAEDEPPPWELLLLADPSRRQVEAYLAAGRCYLAFLGPELIGEFVLLQIGLAETRAGRPTYELMNIAVAESHQGRGWGKQLVQVAIAQARSLGAVTLDVGTGNSSLAQLALYQKCGFRIVGVERDFFIRNYDTEIIENGIRCSDMLRLSLSIQE